MRARLTELGRAVPAARGGGRRRRTSRRSGCPACSRPPAAGTTGAGSGWSASSPRARTPSGRPPRPASRCWPRSWSTSGASWRRWSPGRRAARRRRTRSSPPPSSTASATRWSPRRPTSAPSWRPARSRSRSTIAGELDVTGDPRGRAVRDPRRPGAGQRAGDAAAQHRPLDPGRRGHQPVREPPARGARPAARLAGAAGAVDGDGQHPGRARTAQVGRLYDGYPHALARDPRLRVHLYGKELRPGRKVGHVNAYGDDLEDCLRARPARRGLVPRRPRQRERVSMSDASDARRSAS